MRTTIYKQMGRGTVEYALVLAFLTFLVVNFLDVDFISGITDLVGGNDKALNKNATKWIIDKL